MAIEIVRGGKYTLLLGVNTNTHWELKQLVGKVVTVVVVDNFLRTARLENGRWVTFEELGPVTRYGFGKWFKEFANGRK